MAWHSGGSADASVQRDICVIGGGPAACIAAGELALLGYDVALATCQTPPSHPIESITPLALDLLRARDILTPTPSDTFVTAASHVRWSDERDSLPTSDASISLVRRRGLDERLQSWSVTCGARPIESSTPWHVVPQDTGGWVVSSRGSGKRVRAAFIVAATGRRPILPTRRIRESARLTAVAGFWTDALCGRTARTIVSPAADHWSWTACWPGVGVAALAFCSPSDQRLRDRAGQRELLAALARAALDERSLAAPDSVGISEAGAFRDAEPAGPDWIKVGDSALGVEPITGQGVQLALQSGAIGAACVHTLLQRPGDLPLVTGFLTERHRSVAAVHRRLSSRAYADLAGARQDHAFWFERSGSIGERVDDAPPPASLSLPAADDHLVLHPSARVTRLAACIGSEIAPVEAVLHDNLETPLVYLKGIHVPPLLRRLEAGTRVADVMDRWAIDLGAGRARQILTWLLQHGVVRVVHPSEPTR